MRVVTHGATDQSVELYIVDADGLPATGLAYNSSGIDLWYRRNGAAVTSITEATQTASGAHSDGGFVGLGNGVYRLDPPDAAFASGVSHVTFGGTLTGYTVYPVTVQLSAFDLQTATQSVTVSSLGAGVITATSIASDAITAAKVASDVTTEIQSGLATASSIVSIANAITALPDEAAITSAVEAATPGAGFFGGAEAPIADAVWNEARTGHTTSGTFGGYLDAAISGISVGANPNVILSAEIATVGSQTSFTLATGADFNDAYNGQAIVLYDDSNNDYPSVRTVSDYVGATKTVTLSSAPDFTLGTDDSVAIFATAPGSTGASVADIWGADPTDYAAGTMGGDVMKNTDTIVLSEESAEDLADIIGTELQGLMGTTQPRINQPPDPGFTTQVSCRNDGTYKCTKPIRITSGAITQVFAFIDMSPLFGANNLVETVGTPTVSGGSVTASAEGPRDTYAVVELDGTATAGEERTVTVPVTMSSGTQVDVVFDLEVFG